MPEDAGREARAVIDAFFANCARRKSGMRAGRVSAGAGWAGAMIRKHAGRRCAGHGAAVRYAPAPDCFFEGEDPLARIAALPGSAGARCGPARPWPPSTRSTRSTATSSSRPWREVRGGGYGGIGRRDGPMRSRGSRNCAESDAWMGLRGARATCWTRRSCCLPRADGERGGTHGFGGSGGGERAAHLRQSRGRGTGGHCHRKEPRQGTRRPLCGSDRGRNCPAGTGAGSWRDDAARRGRSRRREPCGSTPRASMHW